MTQLADVHRAVAAKLRAAVSRDVNVAAFPYSAMPLPRIEVWPGEDYLAYYEQSDSDEGPTPVRLRVRIDIDTAEGETAFIQMTDLLAWEGPSSIRAALMSERSLGGVVDDLVVLGAQWETDAENAAQTAWLPVDIVVTKDRP